MIVPLNSEITIPQHILDLLTKYAEDNFLNYYALNRTPEERKQDLFNGKLGEIGAYLIFKKYEIYLSEVDLQNYNSHDDGGKDFHYKDIKIDAKASFYELPLS